MEKSTFVKLRLHYWLKTMKILKLLFQIMPPMTKQKIKNILKHKEKDKRVKYYRNDQNIGSPANFNKVFELSTAEYFMWAGHDDFWDSQFLSSCLNGFSKSKEIVLVSAICKSVDPL